jgi:hypothetical protein
MPGSEEKFGGDKSGGIATHAPANDGAVVPLHSMTSSARAGLHRQRALAYFCLAGFSAESHPSWLQPTWPRERSVSLGCSRARAARSNGESEMATIEQFEDHCWKDVIPAADMKLYSCYARATYVGPRPALLAIDLYNIVYRGGPHSPYDLDPVYPNSCGIYAHRAIEPTKRLFAAARSAAIPIFYCTQETRPNNRPSGAVSTRRRCLARTTTTISITNSRQESATCITSISTSCTSTR